MREGYNLEDKSWRLIPFEENLGILSGFPFDSTFFNIEIGMPLIRIRNILKGITETFFNGDFESEFIIENGDVLVGMDGDFHIARWKGGKALLNQRILKLYAIEGSEINLNYFYYYAQPFLLDVHKRTAGTTVKHLSTKDFKNAKFLLPPIKEQKKIAEILTTVDEKIEVVEQQIKETKELKKGLMQKLLTKGINHSKFKDSPLGQIPDSWEVVKLGDIISNLYSGVSVNSEDRIVAEGEFGILKTSALFDGKFYPFRHKTIINDDISRATIKPIKDTILISRMNTPQLVGECAFVGSNYENLYIPDRIWMTSFNKEFQVQAKYLCYILSSQMIKHKIHLSATGTSNSMKNISKASFLGIQIKFPPKEEQTKIAEILTTVDNKIDILEKKKSEIIDLKKGLMQQLLTGKTRV